MDDSTEEKRMDDNTENILNNQQQEESNAKEKTGEEFDQEDIDKNKAIACLSYLGILFIVPMLVARDSKFVKFHVNQGIILTIASIIVITGAKAILSSLCLFDFMLIIASGINKLISLAVLIVMLMGGYSALTGKTKKLPLIGKFVIYK